jgi:hypothetical protein
MFQMKKRTRNHVQNRKQQDVSSCLVDNASDSSYGRKVKNHDEREHHPNQKDQPCVIHQNRQHKHSVREQVKDRKAAKNDNTMTTSRHSVTRSARTVTW